MTRSVILALFALLFCAIVASGLKQFEIYHHAQVYRVAFLKKDFIENGQRISQERAALLGKAGYSSTDDTVSRWFVIASQVTYFPRYYIVHPVFEISDYLNVDLNVVFSYFIFGIFILYLVSGYALADNIFNAGWVGYILFGGIALIIFLAMNGRAAPAFLGYSLLAHSIVARQSRIVSVHHDSLLRHALLCSAGLLLCTMSTGLFCTGLLLFILGHLTPLGSWLNSDAAMPDHGVPLKRTAFNVALLGVASLFILPLVYRLYDYYGGGLDLLEGVLMHGAGHMIASSIPLLAILAILSLGALWFCLRYADDLVRAVINMPHVFRLPLFLTALPLPLVVVGYLAATPAFVGIGLLLASLANRAMFRT